MKPKKQYEKLQRRIKSWQNPKSARFEEQIKEGGAKCPGSRKRN